MGAIQVGARTASQSSEASGGNRLPESAATDDRRPMAVGRTMIVVSILVWIGATAMVAIADRGRAVDDGLVFGLLLALWAGVLFWWPLSAQPRNRVVWLFLWLAVHNALLALARAVVIRASVERGLPDDLTGIALGDLGPAGAVAALFMAATDLAGFAPAVTLALAWFPDGRDLSRRWSVVPWLVGSGLLVHGAAKGWEDWRFGLDGLDASEAEASVAPLVADLAFLPIVMALVLSVASLVVRYRRSGASVRRQIRWVLWGSAAAALVAVGTTLVGGRVADVGVVVVFAIVFASYSVAIWRHQLFDIDVVITRSITYLGLVAMISAVYVVVVVALPRLLFGDAGDGLGPPLLATAVVAVSFEPARRWFARRAAHLVYGERATPLEVLSQLTAQLSSSADHGTEDLARLVARGSGAEQAVVWALAGDTLRPHGWWSADGSTPPRPVPRTRLVGDAHRAVALVRRGDEVLGAISLSKAAAEPVTAADRDLLADVAANSGLILRNLGLRADLEERARQIRSSRQRLVAARDAERHRLERDLHDGAQQHVVALKVKLDVARAMAIRDDHDAVAQRLAGLSAETQEAVDTLRAVAHGLYPPMLESDGLARALSSIDGQEGLRLRFDVGPVGRFDRRIEETLYFTTLELVNATVEVDGSRLEVTLAIDVDGERLTLDAVADRPVGSAAMTAIGDRVDATEGTMTISTADDGWRVHVSLPASPAVVAP